MPNFHVEHERGWQERLEANLEVIAGIVRGSGARLVFLTYPAGFPLSTLYEQANHVLRQSAARLDVPLVEVTPGVASRCRELPCEDLRKDSHPTVRGHRRAARVVADALPAALRAAEKPAAASPPR
jgi:hypothetical protein